MISVAYNKSTSPVKGCVLMSEIEILEGEVSRLTSKEADFLSFCCNLSYVKYVMVVEKGEAQNSEFFIILNEYDYSISTELMSRCLDFFDLSGSEHELILATDDQINKDAMPTVKVSAKKA